MLRELHICNLAVIEDATIEFGAGLNCFTGETGAGKSLVIGAFELLVGLRGGGSMLRAGAEEGRVSGLFELTDRDVVARVSELADLELDAGEAGGSGESGGGQLLVTRKLFASGRSSVSLNGRPATASMLREIAGLLVDVHGQHDHQFLLKPSNQLWMLDQFAAAMDLRREYGEVHRRLTALRDRRRSLQETQDLRRQKLELLEYQAEEIDAAEPAEGEYERTAAAQKRLGSLRRIREEAGGALTALYDQDGSIIERLTVILGVVNDLGELDGELVTVEQVLADALAALQDASFDLRRYLDRVRLDPAELENVTTRLDELNRLVHKYGSARGSGGLASVLEHRAQVARELQELRGEDQDLDGMDQEVAELEAQRKKLGQQLSRRRRAAADRLAPAIQEQLAELGMAAAEFHVQVEALAGPEAAGASGMDAVEILVRTNPGQPPRPLREIASGGELSRVMLAIKSVAAGADRISVLVFDEVDANIGGRLGSVIGQKLRALAGHHQVLCITHLPQIAAFADRHLKVSKKVRRGQTHSTVTMLGADERDEELAEMIGGADVSATTRRQARELRRLAEAGAKIKPAAKARTGRKKKVSSRPAVRTKKARVAKSR